MNPNHHNPRRRSPYLLIQIKLQIIFEMRQLLLTIEPIPPLPDLQLEFLLAQLQPPILQTNWTIVCIVSPGNMSVAGFRQIC
jgi:hypothetical protein